MRLPGICNSSEAVALLMTLDCESVLLALGRLWQFYEPQEKKENANA